MPLFTWYNKYSVNNEELDKHHRTIFNLFNRLYDSCVDKNDSNNIDPIVHELVAYTQYHFSAEEQYMRDLGFSDIDKHILEHRVFSDRIRDYENDTTILDCEHSKELIVYLGNWILNHVIKEDTKFSSNPTTSL